mmetsp:Transcript_82994/g.165684  ORF Transcript_82994/g.165684 Transcript_82994/m.165684 type:complete len:202 (+) Transcript_82994:403-1008(+)
MASKMSARTKRSDGTRNLRVAPCLSESSAPGKRERTAVSVSSPPSAVCSAQRTSSLYSVPKRDLRCCWEPKQRILPHRMMPMRVQSASHSSIECDVSTIECFDRSRVMRSHMRRRATGSMPEEGSSRNTTAGDPTRATARESLRLLPPDKEPESRSACGVRETCSRRRLTIGIASSTLIPLSRANKSRYSRPVISSRMGST